eukprot:CAMPEP_0174744408 /NCGR_PEP_ID=MMETSP1094-20130205/84251_1 /TAXON_ID=156173 /ORGANISM="Chrysochromulina brevifilum, Strain UTEX LB 985" /LENGTH=106 /DNA_ID=CAMNT_0015948787 /DNA_START=173 /DNA_END=493 /DNA_ORIENTATION=+
MRLTRRLDNVQDELSHLPARPRLHIEWGNCRQPKLLIEVDVHAVGRETTIDATSPSGVRSHTRHAAEFDVARRAACLDAAEPCTTALFVSDDQRTPRQRVAVRTGP